MLYNIVQEYDDTRYVKAVVSLDHPWYEYWQPGLGNGSIGCEYMVFPWDPEIGTVEFEWEEVKPVYDNYSNGGDPWYDELGWEQESLGGGWSGPDVGGSNYVGINRYRVRARITRNDVTYDWVPWSAQVVGQCNYGDNCVNDGITKFCVKGDYDERLSEFAAAHINMPYVYGSHWGHQVRRWVGVDCADMVAHAMGLASQEKEQETGQTGNATIIVEEAPHEEPSASRLVTWAKNTLYGLYYRPSAMEVQELVVHSDGDTPPSMVGGSYTLAFEGQVTQSIPANAGPSTVAAALNALTSIDEVQVQDTGMAGGMILARYHIIFTGQEHYRVNEDLIQCNPGGITGGSAFVCADTDGRAPYPQNGDIVALLGNPEDHAIVVVDGPEDQELGTSHTIIHATGNDDDNKCLEEACPDRLLNMQIEVVRFTP